MTDATLTIIQMVSYAARIMLAYAVFILLAVLMMSNWALPYFSILKPQLLLIIVFYWTLYRPTLMPPPVILIAGILLDAMNPMMPIGTHAASYLLIAGILKPRRRSLMGQPFVVVWVGFAVAAVIDLLFKWLMLSVLTPADLTLGTILFNGFITVLAFPLVVMVLTLVHRMLPAGRGMITR